MPEFEAPHANYSIRIRRTGDRTIGESVHLLYHGGCLIARSRDPLDVLVALMRELTIHDMARRHRVIVRCVVLSRSNGDALLLSAAARRPALQQARRLRDGGLEVVATPAVVLDSQTLEAVVPAPSFAVETEALMSVCDECSSQIDSLMVENRYPIHGWVFLSLPGILTQARKASALVKAVSALWNEPSTEDEGIQTLAEVLRHTMTLAGGSLPSAELLPLLVDRYAVGREPERGFPPD
jgi:hypothetical protein